MKLFDTDFWRVVMVLALVFFTAPVGVAAAADDDLRSPHEGLAASDSSSPDDGEDDGGGSDEDGEDEEEDEEEDEDRGFVQVPFLAHISDKSRPAKEKKSKTTMKHVQKFIEQYHGQFKGIGLTPETDASTLSYEILSDEDFVGTFVNYLATEATYLSSKRSSEKLSHATVSGYASTFCSYYIDKYRDRDIPRPLQTEKWTKKLAALRKEKKDYHKNQGTRMKGQKETATEVDRENICTVSIWKADGSSAQLIHMVNTAHNLAGRSSDVANSDLDDITAVKCVDRHSNETITVPRQGLSRFKTDGDYDHFIFPHINN